MTCGPLGRYDTAATWLLREKLEELLRGMKWAEGSRLPIKQKCASTKAGVLSCGRYCESLSHQRAVPIVAMASLSLLRRAIRSPTCDEADRARAAG